MENYAAAVALADYDCKGGWRGAAEKNHRGSKSFLFDAESSKSKSNGLW